MPNARLVQDALRTTWVPMKICSGCRLDLGVDAYSKCRSHSDGLQKQCKGCSARKFAAYRLRHPERRAGTVKKWKSNNEEKVRESRRKRQYGMPVGQYLEMLKKQNNRCAICLHSIENCCGKTLNVDHCHATGKIRGLLCKGCNMLLGYAENHPGFFDKMSDYMRNNT